MCFPAFFVHNNDTLTLSMVLHVVVGRSFKQFRSLQAMTDFIDQHHDAMISALNAPDYIAKHIMPALMEAGVCKYNPKSKEFHQCQYREAVVKVMQKVRDRKKYLRAKATAAAAPAGKGTAVAPVAALPLTTTVASRPDGGFARSETAEN
jgi:hypothetical protein